MLNSVLEKSRGVWKDYWAPELQDASEVAQRWVRLIEKIKQNRDRIHIVCYEEFVKDPEAVSSRLASYLGVDPAGFLLAEVNPKSIGRYRQGLSPEELSAVIEVAGDVMLEMGYEI
jgi:hypothetical protein